MLQYIPVKFWRGGGDQVGEVKYVVIKIFFSKGGVTLQYEILWNFGWGGGVKLVNSDLKFSLFQGRPPNSTYKKIAFQ